MKKDTRAYSVDVHTNKATMALTHFSPEEFFVFWPELERMLDGVPHTWRQWTKESIQNAVSCGTIQVWGAGPPPLAVCIFFTQINVYPSFKSLHIVWSAGHFDDGMVPLLDAAWMQYAKLNDCEEIEISGRSGWGTKLVPIGFKKAYTTWRRRVPAMRMN